MSAEQTFDDKGKVVARRPPEAVGNEKAADPLTLSQIQGRLDAPTVARMQQTLGNQAVQRALAQRSGGEGAFELDEDTSSAINSARGGGQALDQNMAQQASETLGHDMSGVRVHTDSNAVQLSEQVNARAFTVGSDVFFNQGEYSPGSSSGQELLGHELTHVAQQGGSAAPAGNLSVNDPNDQYEQEADSVAQDIVSRKPAEHLQRQEMPEEEELQAKRVQRQEEEELAMPKRLQRQEEEELQMKPLQRQEEEELQMKRLQRQVEGPEEEEEEMQLKPLDTVQRHAMDEGHEG